MKNLILIITFSLSSMIYAQDEIVYPDTIIGDTMIIYDTLFYDDGSVEYYAKLKLLIGHYKNITGDIYYYNPHNQLEYIAHFDEGELLGHTVYEPLKPEDHE
tara:strand:+ start:13946 stop:14251 length:306 start_codon:yes stop_codon:yes gene_type:complete